MPYKFLKELVKMHCKVYTDKETFVTEDLEEADKIFRQAKNAIFTVNDYVVKNSATKNSINKARFKNFIFNLKINELVKKIYE